MCKRKIDTLNFIEISLCKDVQEKKGQTIRGWGGEICAKYICDKVLYPKQREESQPKFLRQSRDLKNISQNKMEEWQINILRDV